MLDKIIALHNLPADTKDEHLKNITDACITLWEHNPKFSFKIIEEVISQKLLLRYDQEKVLDAVRLCRSKAKTEVNEAVPVQSKASPIDPHVPTADNGDGDDNDENAQALTIQHI